MKLTLAHWALLISFFLPYACAGIAKAGRRDYDNADPRGWEQRLSGYRRRGIAAMNNTFEALPFFAAAVIVAHQLGVEQGRLDGLAIAWLILRVVYVGAYVADRATMRSLVWILALATNAWIFLLGA
ncbi:MAG TPA: MAPEG family protein [Burkholderiaceae bacterium]|nr:MAPEG family protein [Burkholderiaceae bacterium]